MILGNGVQPLGLELDFKCCMKIRMDMSNSTDSSFCWESAESTARMLRPDWSDKPILRKWRSDLMPKTRRSDFNRMLEAFANLLQITETANEWDNQLIGHPLERTNRMKTDKKETNKWESPICSFLQPSRLTSGTYKSSVSGIGVP